MDSNLDFINNLLNSRLKRNVFSAVSKTEVLQNRLYYEDSASAADALPAEPDAESLAGSQLVTEK